MERYILALDQGTTSSRALVFDQNHNIRGIAQKTFTQHFPREGWVEHDPMDIYNTQCEVMLHVLATCNISITDIAAIGITNQRETTIVWDKHTGEPIYNAIVWQCRRTADIVSGLVQQGLSTHIQQTTGLVPDAYFSATKIKWILDHVEGARERAQRGDLLFGTVDSWLVFKLTNGAVHKTDYTNASRTMLFDIHRLDWDETLLRALDIPRPMLPTVCPSCHLFGRARIQGADIPITGIAGDQQAALFGQCCFEAGEAKNTYGTGCFLLMNTGNVPVASQNGLITTIAASQKGIRYALEGSVFVGGAVIQWLRDELRLLSSSSESESLAESVANTGGVYLVPAFTGMGAPYWDMYARGCLIGMTRGTQRAHIVRAALEAIAYQSLDLVQSMEKDIGSTLPSLKVDGGASLNGFLMQFQSDMLNKPLFRPFTQETTALGAACLAGLSVGLWQDEAEIRALWKQGAAYKPHMPQGKRDELLNGWHRAVERSRNWVEQE